MRANGRYRAAAPRRQDPWRARLLTTIGLVVVLFAAVNAVLVNGEMERLEADAPPRFAEVGSGLGRVIPSIVAYVMRGNVPVEPVTAGDVAVDPRRTRPYLAAKGALERWLALAGLGLASVILGLDMASGPASLQRGETRSLGSDLSRLLVLLSLAYAGLSLFEGG